MLKIKSGGRVNSSVLVFLFVFIASYISATVSTFDESCFDQDEEYFPFFSDDGIRYVVLDGYMCPVPVEEYEREGLEDEG